MLRVKNFFFTAGLIASLTLSCAAQPKTVDLPKPVTSGGRPIMDAFSNRHAERDFLLQKDIPRQIVSNLLWATWGVNRADGKRTAPTAMDRRNIDVYVAKEY